MTCFDVFNNFARLGIFPSTYDLSFFFVLVISMSFHPNVFLSFFCFVFARAYSAVRAQLCEVTAGGKRNVPFF